MSDGNTDVARAHRLFATILDSGWGFAAFRLAPSYATGRPERAVPAAAEARSGRLIIGDQLAAQGVSDEFQPAERGAYRKLWGTSGR
jgi:hypothetical protein